MAHKSLIELACQSAEIFYAYPVAASQYSSSPSLSSSLQSSLLGSTLGTVSQSFALLLGGSLMGKMPELSTLGYLSLFPLATNVITGAWQYTKQKQYAPAHSNQSIVGAPDFPSQFSSPSSNPSSILSSPSQPLVNDTPQANRNAGFTKDEIGAFD